MTPQAAATTATRSTAGTRSLLRSVVGAVVAIAIIHLAAAVALLVSVTTMGQARRFVMDVIIARLSALILAVLDVRVDVVGDPFWRRAPNGPQTVYVFNHTSSLDLFVVCVLGLPRVRFFMKRKFLLFVPMGLLGLLSGTFFTMPQSQPAARTRLFQRATDILRRTGESVFLSPEGTRVTTGEIGHFNKGAFHLAAALRAPIVPLYFETPRDVDPGRGLLAGQGAVRVHVLPTIDTSSWREDAVAAHADEVRAVFVAHHDALRAADGAPA